jgi:hypothetical protein
VTSIQNQIDVAIKRKVDENLDKTVRATAMAAMRALTMETPVDTGRAKNNWNADINAVDASITETANPSADGTDKINAALASYKQGDTVFISNNLPYIRRLNEGHSKQAPAGFVEAAVMLAKRQGKQIAKRELNK